MISRTAHPLPSPPGRQTRNCPLLAMGGGYYHDSERVIWVDGMADDLASYTITYSDCHLGTPGARGNEDDPKNIEHFLNFTTLGDGNVG